MVYNNIHGASLALRRNYDVQRLDNTPSPVKDPVLDGRFVQPLGTCFQAAAPMSLNSNDIARIANLARLELQPGESDRMLHQINSFFDLVEQMRVVDTRQIVPLAHPLAAVSEVALRLREDMASETDNRQANQQSAPATERGLFLVPRVIE